MTANEDARGKLITFEYVDGGEPQPFIQKIVDEFFSGSDSEDVVTEREPTDGLFGQPIRTVLSRDWEEVIHWRQLVYGFLADRVHHIEKKYGIRNLLTQGKTVICDRYNLSTYAYQLPSDSSFDWYYKCSEDILVPDLTLFLKFDIDSCVENSLHILPNNGNRNEFSILNRKTRRHPDELRKEIIRVEEMYSRAINYLRSKVPPQNIEVVEAKDFTGTWYKLRPLIQKCLQK
jgi:thymidylate kinase